MKALVVLAHPNDQSFNRAILSTVINSLEGTGHEFRVRDLYSKRFSPVLELKDFEEFMAGRTPIDILHEQEAILWADTLIFIYPIWWWGPPAVLKGWFDRVFSQGFAYKNTPQGVEPLLTGKKVVVFTTSGSTKGVWEENGISASVHKLMIEGIYGFVGIKDIIYKNFYGVPTSTLDERKEMLYEVRDIVSHIYFRSGRNS